jgi:hypothetical protein
LATSVVLASQPPAAKHVSNNPCGEDSIVANAVFSQFKSLFFFQGKNSTLLESLVETTMEDLVKASAPCPTIFFKILSMSSCPKWIRHTQEQQAAAHANTKPTGCEWRHDRFDYVCSLQYYAISNCFYAREFTNSQEYTNRPRLTCTKTATVAATETA